MLAPGTEPAGPRGPARWRRPPPAAGAAGPGAAGSGPEALVQGLPRATAKCRGLCLPRRLTLAVESGPVAGRAEEDDLPWGKLFRV